MMRTMADQAVACGMQGAMLAHSFNLYDGTSGLTLADYAAVIGAYQ